MAAAKTKPGHSTISATIWVGKEQMMPKKKRKIFRKEWNPNYGILQNGMVVQRLQIGITSQHKWFLKGTGRA